MDFLPTQVPRTIFTDFISENKQSTVKHLFMRSIISLLSIFFVLAMTSFTQKNRLTVSSSSFTANGAIPSKYSCEGRDVNPPLSVSGAPAGTKSLALILHDPDAPMAGGFTHWVMWNLDVSGNIPEDFKGAEQGMNSAKSHSYKGMCPPSGTHHYHFKVYALDTKLSIDKHTDKAGLEKAMQGHILAEGDLVGTYAKTK
jgi:Raf kinase inhibitor-like YbhB/YbcL family protein